MILSTIWGGLYGLVAGALIALRIRNVFRMSAAKVEEFLRKILVSTILGFGGGGALSALTAMIQVLGLDQRSVLLAYSLTFAIPVLAMSFYCMTLMNKRKDDVKNALQKRPARERDLLSKLEGPKKGRLTVGEADAIMKALKEIAREIDEKEEKS